MTHLNVNLLNLGVSYAIFSAEVTGYGTSKACVASFKSLIWALVPLMYLSKHLFYQGKQPQLNSCSSALAAYFTRLKTLKLVHILVAV